MWQIYFEEYIVTFWVLRTIAIVFQIGQVNNYLEVVNQEGYDLKAYQQAALAATAKPPWNTGQFPQATEVNTLHTCITVYILHHS